MRYGLANESKKMNSFLKSSDLIGITPIKVEQEHVGSVFGVFTSIEVKHGGWKYTGRGREEAQERWIKLVVSLGGIGWFAS